MIYLASPYTHPDPQVREARWREAVRAAAKLTEAGDVVFSPMQRCGPRVVGLASLTGSAPLATRQAVRRGENPMRLLCAWMARRAVRRLQLDALFARVFATPAGAELRAALGGRSITEPEIKRRIARARARWATGRHHQGGRP